MTQRAKLFSVLGAVLLVGLIFYSQTPVAPDRSGQLVVGVVFPLTGDAASYGEKGRQAIDLAMDELAKRGMKRQIRIVYEDSRADASTGAAAANKLLGSDRAVAIVGDIVSAVTLAIAPIAERNKTVLLSPTSSAPAITNAGEFIYRIWPSDTTEGSAIGKVAYQRGFRRVAIMHLTNDYGSAISDVFQKTFSKEGGTVVAVEGYQAETVDLRNALSKMARASPDSLYIAGYFADTATIIRQARELGLRVQVFGTTAIEDPKFLELARGAAEGMIYPLAGGFDPDRPDQQVRDFVASFQRRYNHAPGWVEAHAYDAIGLITQAVEQSRGPVDGASIKNWLDSMPPYNGVTGQIKFDANGDVSKPVMMKIIRQGRFESLESK